MVFFLGHSLVDPPPPTIVNYDVPAILRVCREFFGNDDAYPFRLMLFSAINNNKSESDLWNRTLCTHAHSRRRYCGRERVLLESAAAADIARNFRDGPPQRFRLFGLHNIVRWKPFRHCTFAVRSVFRPRVFEFLRYVCRYDIIHCKSYIHSVVVKSTDFHIAN